MWCDLWSAQFTSKQAWNPSIQIVLCGMAPEISSFHTTTQHASTKASDISTEHASRIQVLHHQQEQQQRRRQRQRRQRRQLRRRPRGSRHQSDLCLQSPNMKYPAHPSRAAQTQRRRQRMTTTTNDERRTTNDERRTTNDERRTTNDEQRTTKDERRTKATAAISINTDIYSTNCFVLSYLD